MLVLQDDSNREMTGVIGPLLRNRDVLRCDSGSLLQHLLQAPFRIQLLFVGQQRGDIAAEELHDKRTGRVPPPVDMNRSNHCLERSRQHAITDAFTDPLPGTEVQAGMKAEFPRPAHECLGADDRDALPRERPLIGRQVPLVEVLGDDGAEYGITEELEPLVALEFRLDIRDGQPVMQHRAMGQRKSQDQRVTKGDPDSRGQPMLGCRVGHPKWCRCKRFGHRRRSLCHRFARCSA